MRNICLILLACLATDVLSAQSWRFEDGELMNENGYFTIPEVPDGNYLVTVRIGSALRPGVTTIRGESRRLFFENVETVAGQFTDVTFVINKRDTLIAPGETVRIKPRELTKLNWDGALTFEFTGPAPEVEWMTVERISEGVITLYLAGDSTVVDQDDDPWASWGQMITRFFDDRVAIANHAESGESANGFIAEGRLKKILSRFRPGDYLFIEFGHNDMKQIGEGKGAYLHYYESLKELALAARAAGGHPILLTPTQRRNFDDNGKIVNTHEDYPDAMKKLASDENIPLIDLHSLTKTFYEALGVEGSKRSLVHYPAGSFPGQTEPLADNTHFNPYGAYEVAKMVVEGIKKLDMPLASHIRLDYRPYDPAHPDDPDTFVWTPSKRINTVKPDGN
jgi:lysophospholipase L1-like esterase